MVMAATAIITITTTKAERRVDGSGNISAGEVGGAAACGIDARLLVWLSPAFPVGSYAYSHGLEWAVHRGWVRTRMDLEAWLSDLVQAGSLRCDMMLVAAAWRAASQLDVAGVAEINDLALALQPSAERHLESVSQGNAFLAAALNAWTSPALAAMADKLAGDVAYVTAVGMVTGGHAIGLPGVVQAFGIAGVGNLTSAAIRLSVIGHSDGQAIMAALMGPIGEAADAALRSSLDDIGSATLRSDLASLAHETQYSRLFRS